MSASPNNLVYGSTVTITATVSTGLPSSNAALKPTGTISFTSTQGSITSPVTITTGQDSGGNWILQATVTTAPQQSELITANYSGDTNYEALYQNVFVNVTIPDFTISASSSPLVLTAGQTGTAT